MCPAPVVPLTRAHLLAAAADERWSGGGYLLRRRDAEEDVRQVADMLLLSYATAAGWTYEDLFAFVDGYAGRLLAYEMFDGGEGTPQSRFAAAVRDGLLKLPSPNRWHRRG